MTSSFCALRAGTRPIWLVVAALALAVLAPEVAHAGAGDPSRSDVSWNTYRPAGWSAGSVATSTGYSRPGGSQRVREVQKRLNRLGYGAGEVDGLFGPLTQAAVQAFQADSELAVDGIVGPQTLRGLRTRTSQNARLLKVGTGYARAGGSERVREIQSRLNRLGFDAGEVDGLYGPRTEFAVVSYQADKSLPVDGVVGPQTQLALTGSSQRPTSDSGGTQQTKGEQPRAGTRPDADATRPLAQEDSGGGQWWTPVLWVAAALALIALVAVLLRALAPRLRRIRSARQAAQKQPPAPGAAGIQTERAGGPVTAAAVEKEEEPPPATLRWLVARISLAKGPEEPHVIHVGPELIAESDQRSWETGVLDDHGRPFAIAREDFESSLRHLIVSEGLPRLAEILRKDGLDLSAHDLESMPLVVELTGDLRKRLGEVQPTASRGGPR